MGWIDRDRFREWLVETLPALMSKGFGQVGLVPGLQSPQVHSSNVENAECIDVPAMLGSFGSRKEGTPIL